MAVWLTAFAPTGVTVATVTPRDLTAQVYGNGTVEAKVVVGISSKITGRIVDLRADQGDHVEPGALLAKLENADLAEQVRQAEAAVEKARASQRIEAATLKKALANLELAEKNGQRFEALFRKGVVSQREGEEYAVACQVAREEVNRSRAALASARMEEDQGLASQRFAKARLADTAIHAPGGGLIVSRDLELGAVVSPGQAIFLFTDPGTVWIKANIDESRMADVKVGNPATITLRGAPGEQYPGRVARIGRQSDRITEESEVDVAFDPPLEGFRLGEQADVVITTQDRKGVPSLPAAAVASKGRARGVWVLRDGRLTFRDVALGIEDRRDFVEVKAGLGEGDRVVLAPFRLMGSFVEGMRARATP